LNRVTGADVVVTSTVDVIVGVDEENVEVGVIVDVIAVLEVDVDSDVTWVEGETDTVAEETVVSLTYVDVSVAWIDVDVIDAGDVEVSDTVVVK